MSDHFLQDLKEASDLPLKTERAQKHVAEQRNAALSQARTVLYFCLSKGWTDEQALWFSTSGIDAERLAYYFERHEGEVDDIRKDVERWQKAREAARQSVETLESHKSMADGKRINTYCVQNEFPEADTVMFATSGISFVDFVKLHEKVLSELYEGSEVPMDRVVQAMHQKVQKWLESQN